MTFDEFAQKFSNIEKQYDDQLIKAIIAEFGSLDELAFAILEGRLSDRSKYSYLCFAMTNEGVYAMGNGKANKLSDKLAEFKKEYFSQEDHRGKKP